MNTPDPSALTLGRELPGEREMEEAAGALGGGGSWPDAGTLTQWANEMFKGLSGVEGLTAAPAMPAGGPTIPAALPAMGGYMPPMAIPDLGFGMPAAPGPEMMGAQSGLYLLDNVARATAQALGPQGQAPVPSKPESAHAANGYAFQPQVVPDLTFARDAFDVGALRADFPVLGQQVNGRPLVWLDNAATTQKPWAVIDRLASFYAHENSNVHRGAHTLAARSTDAYEGAREKVRAFLNAPSAREIVFLRGTTEAINLVAQSYGRKHVRAGDEVVISWIEHHSNIVPWQQLCAETGAKLKVIPVDDHGQVLLDAYERLLGPRTRIVALAQVSNALGTVLPVEDMVAMGHRYGAKVLVDGAQAVSHMAVDVQQIDCDFYAFSGHKVFGPTGIGALFGKVELLDAMPPWQGGGNMIQDVTFEKVVYHPSPMRFEAGTGNIADAVGLGAALDYLKRIGFDNIARHEHELLRYGTEQLSRIPGLTLIGTAREKAGVMSFVMDGIPSEEVGRKLAGEGIAVRAGHHCAQPALRRFGHETTVRPSLALYNTCEDIDALIAALNGLRSGAR